MTAFPGTPAPEYASTSRDNARWFVGEQPIRAEHLETMIDFARSHGRPRFFIWTAPWLYDAESERVLAAGNAVRLTDVRQVALARATSLEAPWRAPGVVVRRVGVDEAERVFDAVQSWYGADGARTNLRGVRAGMIDLFVACIDDAPAGIAILSLDEEPGGGAWLGGAGTDPAWRGRGVQKALIMDRVRRAAEVGARWCSGETNDVNTISLENMRRCGFEVAFEWVVHQWDERRA